MRRIGAVANKLPTLYKLTSKGAVQIWEIEVTDNVITTTHGQIDGKKQIISETINQGKNIGKKNATTSAQQAESEAASEWTKKQTRQGYILNKDLLGDVKEEEASVMLAHKYSEHADKMPKICYSQPKFDGHRCKAVTINGVCTLYSRTGKIITGVPHINKYLESNFAETILDGELYNHDYRNKFEELTSFIRQDNPKVGHEIVQLHLYDVMKCPEMTSTDSAYSIRWNYLRKKVISVREPIVIVKTRKCQSAEDVELFFRQDLADGYEGSMLRDPDSPYKNGRSYGLQKVKEMDDAEFKILSVKEGRGKLAGHAIFVCELSNGDTFDCKKDGSFDYLKYIFENSEKFIGKNLTVQYQGFTKYGKPRFPVGLRLREDP